MTEYVLQKDKLKRNSKDRKIGTSKGGNQITKSGHPKEWNAAKTAMSKGIVVAQRVRKGKNMSLTLQQNLTTANQGSAFVQHQLGTGINTTY